MKLYGLIETIKKLCKSFPNVNGVYVGDVYELNKLQSVEYAAMVITEQAHLVNQDEGYSMYQVNVFYIDREVEDKGNVLDVHSHGISLLNRLVEELEEIGCIIQNNYRINTFEERFTSVCAGAYGTFDIRIPFEECEQLKIVTSVNGQTGDVFINTQGVTEEELNDRLREYAKVTDVPSFLDIPTHTSQLTNDSGFLTETDLPIIPTKTSDLTNDSGFLTEHQSLKTINNQSIVGTGNITIQGGGGDVYLSRSNTFTGLNTFKAEVNFNNASYNIPSTDISQGIACDFKTTMIQASVLYNGVICYPQSTTAFTSLGRTYSIEANNIKIGTDGTKVNSSGIYENGTLLSNKYAAKNSVPTFEFDSATGTLNIITQ